MEIYSPYKKIARLIAGEIGPGLTQEEKKELADWLNEDLKNKELFNRIKSSANYRKWAETRGKINLHPSWENLFKAIQKEKKRTMFRKMLKYAAVICFPLIVAGGIYYIFNQVPEQAITSQTTEIRPGCNKAVLVLNDGESVALDSPDDLLLKEKDGTTIQKTEGLLNYTKPVQKLTKVPLFNTISIPRGGEYNLILADGTRVFLNAMSKFKYPVQFTGATREVELTGEAYFEVTHSGTPFIVKTNGMDVEVMGTSFNVNAYENTGKVVTTLVEGKVKIESKGPVAGSRLLYPDEQAVFDLTDHRVDVNKVDVNLYTAWKEGKFIFYDTRLEDIMNTLTRWYSADVIFSDPEAKELHFSGSIDRYGDIQQILEIIQSTNKVEIEINKTTILFKRKK
ncbi:MAG: DUF4974 domain-containing protein [Bacteroidetes bacterium]|nr:DUF4974 domain-containing protein [Bacteroidota bacterium]